jgi:hypothetical protein
MNPFVPFVKRALQASVIAISMATALSGYCASEDIVVPHDAKFRGRTYADWQASFWQWALALPVNGSLPHPFNDCTRPISAAQTGGVWYWSAPDVSGLVCDQRATTIPPGTAVFLTMLDVEASSLDAQPFFASTADEQRQIAMSFANYISDLFCTIDGRSVMNIPAYRTLTQQFSFFAPTPWVFNQVGGKGTAVGDGYFLMLESLSPGEHTIHYGGTFHIPAGVLGPDPVNIPKDVTLCLRVGPGKGDKTDRPLVPCHA